MDTSNKDNSIEIITTSLIKSLIDDLMKENKNSIQLEYLSELSQNIENINSSNIDIYLKNVIKIQFKSKNKDNKFKIENNKNDENLVKAYLQLDFGRMEKLICNGANIHTNILGRPLIIDAALNKNIELIKFLISVGVDIESTDEIGQSALMISGKYQNLTSVIDLLKASATVNQCDINGNEAIHYTAGSRFSVDENISKKIISILLDYGSNANSLNKMGKNALLLALISKRLKISEYLMPLTDLNNVCKEGLSALKIANLLKSTAISVYWAIDEFIYKLNKQIAINEANYLGQIISENKTNNMDQTNLDKSL